MDNQPKPDLNKFFKDPEFHFVLEMLSQNTKGIEDINTIDITQSAETVKAVVAGRQETLRLVENFKSDIETYKSKTINSDKTQSFK